MGRCVGGRNTGKCTRTTVRVEPGCPLAAALDLIRGHLDHAWLADVVCARCERPMTTTTSATPRLVDSRLVSLDETDCCRWCARPITAEAERKVPLDGYRHLARELLRDDRTYGHDMFNPSEVA